MKTPEYAKLFSKSAQRMQASEIRELLKLLDIPGMISFAGGLPNPDAFPIEGIKTVVSHVMEKHPREALQYGTTEGHRKLRDVISRGMGAHYGAPQKPENIVVTTGSQQALDLISKILLNEGDIVLTTNPSYIGALQVFQAYGARVETVSLSGDDLPADAVAEKLEKLKRSGTLPKFMYLVSNFQNPTGITVSAENRRKIYELLCLYDILLIEDDPYGLLIFEGQRMPLIKSMDTEDRVVYLGSFSKILAPGFRVAWIAGPEPLVNRVTVAKQSQDLCTNTFGQFCVFEAIHHNILFPHIEDIIRLYKAKRDMMLKALEQYFPPEARWTHPRGGLFLWIDMPENIDTVALLKKAVKNQVAYVPGAPFFPNGGGRNTLRLNFSYARDTEIAEGIARLGEVIKEEMRSAK
jgi:2-aminoadipate transaminase